MSDENAFTEYLAGAHRERPRFTQWVYELTQPLAIARERLANFRRNFDIDTAFGSQLDHVGVRVGITRTVPLTISDRYFALDDVGGIGLDRGKWKDDYDPTDRYLDLDDESYRGVLKTKVLINHFDGSTKSLSNIVYGLLDAWGLSHESVKVIDGMNMSVKVQIKETVPPALQELLSRRILDIISAGVSVTFEVV